MILTSLILSIFLLLSIVQVKADFVNLQRLHQRWLDSQAADSSLRFQGNEIDASASFDSPLTLFFNQTLDHFSADNGHAKRQFNQRFYLNRAHYKNGGPVLVYIGGESELRATSATRGSIVDLAKRTGALILALEHRYYGISHPFTELTAQTMRYLSSDQALHDLANFIQRVPQELNRPELAKAKWLVVGGSYPGNLAAWFRLKFPHLVVGAWASSAPVLAKADFYEYDQVVGEQLGAQCADRVRAATRYLEGVIGNRDRTTVDSVKNWFHHEMAAQVTDNVSFLYVLADVVAYTVQYDNPGVGLRDRLCSNGGSQFVENSPKIIAQQFANFTRFFFRHLRIEPREMDVTWYSRTRIESPSENMRQWMWQSCVEFGYWQIAPTDNSVRSHLITTQWHHENVCNGLFKLPKSHEAPVDAVNTKYGGLKVAEAVDHVIFTNGKRDPWYALSIPGNPVVPEGEMMAKQQQQRNSRWLIPGVGHCADLRGSTSEDSRSLDFTRLAIFNEISSWLTE